MVAVANRRRSMLLVGMFELWGVYYRVMRSDKGETDSDSDCKSDRGSQGGPNGVTGELNIISQCEQL